MKIQITKKILFSFLLTLSLNTANAQGFGGFLSGLKNKIIEAKPFLKANSNPLVYLNFKEALRILRKMKYNDNK